jgi:hypothetical protein
MVIRLLAEKAEGLAAGSRGRGGLGKGPPVAAVDGPPLTTIDPPPIPR